MLLSRQFSDNKAHKTAATIIADLSCGGVVLRASLGETSTLIRTKSFI